MVPAARTDDLFGHNEDNMDTGSSPSVTRRNSTSSSTVKPASKKRLAQRNRMYYPEDDQFNRFLAVVTKRAAQSTDDTELEKASKVVKLMGEFDQATKHMKCPIKAAYFVPSFIQFLTPAQKKELKEYKKEMAKAEDELSDDEDN